MVPERCDEPVSTILQAATHLSAPEWPRVAALSGRVSSSPPERRGVNDVTSFLAGVRRKTQPPGVGYADPVAGRCLPHEAALERVGVTERSAY